MFRVAVCYDGMSMSKIDLSKLDLASLKILRYPDPRLRESAVPVETVDESFRALAERMFELMFSASGVGLAAPQVGVPIQMFVGSPNYEHDDRRVYINPKILALEGSDEDEEGCLSFPGITCKIKRAASATIEAVGLDGQTFRETVDGLAARLVQHETDHLYGRLLVDRMGTLARLANRRSIKELEEKFSNRR